MGTLFHQKVHPFSVCLFFFFFFNPVSFSQNDINLHSETCEMTTIHLQTLVIKAGLGFFLHLFFKLLLHSPPFLTLVCCQCFQAEIKRNSLLISGSCNKATIVCLISKYLWSWCERDGECVCVCSNKQLLNKQEERELTVLICFKCEVNLNDSVYRFKLISYSALKALSSQKHMW